MARPTKKRMVCAVPENCSMVPEKCSHRQSVTMTVDEYETVRLIDLEGKTQEECAQRMGVARTTVQGIYNSARQKLADSLVNRKKLEVTGGDYKLCECCSHGCRKCPYENGRQSVRKDNDFMKIAVTYENGQIFQHFGHTEKFKIYEVENKQITNEEIVDTMGSGHGALAEFLRQQGVDTLICGGIGEGAKNALAAAGIKLYGGCAGSADLSVMQFIEGSLGFNPDVLCTHHSHEGSGCGSSGSCGSCSSK